MPLSSRVTDLGPFELLLSVARLGSLGAAAREHGISQPAASSRIKYLERRLGVTLLERSPQGSRLTGQGALVADWARTALDGAAALEAGIASLHNSAEARLPVAASLTIAEYLLPHWLVRFHRARSGTAVSLTTGNSEEVAVAVLDGTVAIGFVEGPTVPPGLAAQCVGHDELTVIVFPGHPWTRPGRRRVSAEELAGTPLSAVRPAPAPGFFSNGLCGPVLMLHWPRPWWRSPRPRPSRQRWPRGSHRPCSVLSPYRGTLLPASSLPYRSRAWTCHAHSG